MARYMLSVNKCGTDQKGYHVQQTNHPLNQINGC